MSQFHFQCVSHSLISVCLTLPHIHEGSHSLTLNTLTLAVSSPPSPKDFPTCVSATNTGFHGFHGFHAYLQQIQFTHRISCVSVTNTIHSQDFMNEIVLLRFSSTLPDSPHWCLAHLLQTQFLVRVLSTRDFLHPIVPFFLPLLQRLPFCAT